ncbi:hypothetical protein [Bacillus sp. JCM 19041]|uniref:hypothetical protein n=1 Tax=Bacillus sp. JCM 19041 TaxID=1460637 RepID=UPI0006CFEA4E
MGKLQEVIQNAAASGEQLMGDDVNGFKFVGDEQSYWNKMLDDAIQSEVMDQIDTNWLSENNLPYLDFDYELWNAIE